MTHEIPIRRMTLRQLLTHTDKCVRHLEELLRVTMMNRISEFRDLSRPVRKRSHYPTMLAVHNSLKKLLECNEEVRAVTEQLEQYLEAIREHTRRELANRT